MLLRLDSFFSGALCVLSGERLPEALFMVFLLDSKGAKVCESCRSRQGLSKEYLLFIIYLQHSATIQPRRDLSKFTNN